MIEPSRALPTLVMLAAITIANGEPIRLPLSFQPMPVTTITVGDSPVRAIVDTTAGDADGELTLDKEIIEQAHGSNLGFAVMRDAAGTQFAPAKFDIPFVVVDGRRIEHVKAVQALDVANAVAPTPNVIGKHFLSKFFVILNFADSSLTLWPRDTRAPPGADCGRTRIRMQSSAEQKFAIGAFATDAGHLRLALNTASNFSFLTESAAARKQLATESPAPGAPRFYATGTLSAGNQNFGATNFTVLNAELPRGIDGMLGKPFFEHRIVCLDYARHEIRIR